MKLLAILGGTPIVLVVLLGAAFGDDGAATLASGINVAAIPALARQELPFLTRTLSQQCPALPLVWLVAQAQAESGWNPRAYSSAGAAGLLQMTAAAWAEAGGQGGTWPVRPGPRPDHPVWQPEPHLATAINWMCGNLHLLAQHLQTTHKPIDLLDALAVCHLAGCSRVTDSRTGIPTPGEAGCPDSCVQQIHAYLTAIHHWIQLYTAPASATPTGLGSAPQPFPGGRPGCIVPDPTGSGGCVTTATAWLLIQVAAHVHRGPVTCWDPHLQNPSSDHPLGKACDYLIGSRLGVFPAARDVAEGWALADWLRTYAGPLDVAYVIWQGRIWSQTHNAQGWRPYSGGGIYNPEDPTGGHYDHVHVSLTQ